MLTKTVADADGVRVVECTPEEEAEIRAEWAANEAKPALPPVDPLQKLKDFLAANPDVAKLVC